MNTYKAFLRSIRGLDIDTTDKIRLYDVFKSDHEQDSLVQQRQQQCESKINDINLNDKTVLEWQRYVQMVVRHLNLSVGAFIASGSYGIVFELLKQNNILKLYRISPIRKKPILLPVLNQQRTQWHSVTQADFDQSIFRHMKIQQQNQIKQIGLRLSSYISSGCILISSKEQWNYVILSKIQGVTLCKVLNTITHESICQLLIEKSAKLLQLLHSHNIVHGDFHLLNILSDSRAHLHLLDFDRTIISKDVSHQLHDISMFMNTCDTKYWSIFLNTYFHQENASNPFIAGNYTDSELRAEMAIISRKLFEQYMEYLKA